MVLFTILLIMLVLLVLFTVLVVGAGGAVFTIIFGDVIVCIVLIALLIGFLIKRRNKK